MPWRTKIRKYEGITNTEKESNEDKNRKRKKTVAIFYTVRQMFYYWLVGYVCYVTVIWVVEGFRIFLHHLRNQRRRKLHSQIDFSWRII